MRVLFALPGFHKYDRGAEIALIAVAEELAKSGDAVTLIGSGPMRPDSSYRFIHASSVSRDHFRRYPSVPLLRTDYAYEELTFTPQLLRKYRPSDYDLTLTCSFPFTNLLLRRPCWHGTRPKHVYVTQNGDWPASSHDSEYRFFNCDGLVCTNPDYLERNKKHWNCRLIPNGVDCGRFRPGPDQRANFSLAHARLVVLMVSALIPSKRVHAGIEAVSRIPGAHLLVAGTGPLQEMIQASAQKLLPQRFTLLSMPADRMPDLYRSADVFLHLSKEESFGNVFLEAMASGLPVVGHDSPRLRWIVGEGQFLVETENADDVVSAISRAAAVGPLVRHENVTRAASFSWAAIGKQYRDFLGDVLAGTRNDA